MSRSGGHGPGASGSERLWEKQQAALGTGGSDGFVRPVGPCITIGQLEQHHHSSHASDWNGSERHFLVTDRSGADTDTAGTPRKARTRMHADMMA